MEKRKEVNTEHFPCGKVGSRANLPPCWKNKLAQIAAAVKGVIRRRNNRTQENLETIETALWINFTAGEGSGLSRLILASFGILFHPLKSVNSKKNGND